MSEIAADCCNSRNDLNEQALSEESATPRSKEPDFVDKQKQAENDIHIKWSQSSCEDTEERPNFVTSVASPSTASEVSSPVLKSCTVLNLLDDVATPAVRENVTDSGLYSDTAEKRGLSFQLSLMSAMSHENKSHGSCHGPGDCVSFACAVGSFFNAARSGPCISMAKTGDATATAPTLVSSLQPPHCINLKHN